MQLKEESRLQEWLSRLPNHLLNVIPLFHDLYESNLVQDFDHLIRRIDLMPANAPKIGASAQLVVIVVIAFAHHQEVKRQEVLGGVSYFKVSVSILMRKPVDDRAMDGAHQEMDRQKQPEIPGRGKLPVERNI